MLQVTYTSLTAPSSREAGSTMVRRAAACLKDKMSGTADGVALTFDCDAVEGRVVVRGENLVTMRNLPLSIGSPMGHFGQFETTGNIGLAFGAGPRQYYSLI